MVKGSDGAQRQRGVPWGPYWDQCFLMSPSTTQTVGVEGTLSMLAHGPELSSAGDTARRQNAIQGDLDKFQK